MTLEELLTYLELYHTFPGTTFHVNPWDQSDSDGIRRLITEKLPSYQFDLNKMAWQASHAGERAVDVASLKKVAAAWAAVVSLGDIVLTFNWDILHEIIFWRAGLWNYKDGYGFHCPNQGDSEQPSKV